MALVEKDYREPTTTDLAPEVRALLHDAGLPTTRVEIEAESRESPGVVARMLRSAPRDHWLARHIFLSVGLNRRCDFDAIPEPARSAARRLGFQPVVWVLHGMLVPLKTPTFIAPDGFVMLEVFGARRVYLLTYLDDGTSVSTAPGDGGNVNTEYLKGTNDLAHDYRAHVERVLERVLRNGCRPVYRGTRRALLAAYRLFPAYFLPPKVATVLVVGLVGWIAIIVSLAVAVFG